MKRWSGLAKVRSLYHALPRALTPLAVAGALLVIALLLHQNWPDLVAFEWRVNYLSAACSMLLCVATWLLFGFNWSLIVGRLGSDLRIRDNMRLYYLSSVAKFIPGRVWHVASRLYVYDREGVGRTLTSVALVLETALVVLSGAVVYALFSIVSPQTQIWQGWRFLFVLMVPLVAILVYPSILVAVVNLLLDRLGKPRLSIRLSYRDTLLWLALYALNWCVGGMVFYYLANALHALPLSYLTVAVESVCLSGVVTQLAFFIPAGLGAREVAMVYLLSPPIPMPVSILSSLAFRIWLIVGEVGCLLALNVWRSVAQAVSRRRD